MKTRVDTPFIARTIPYIIITALIAIFDGIVAFDLFNLIYSTVSKGTAILMASSLVLVLDGIPILYAHVSSTVRKQKAVRQAKIFMLSSIALVFVAYFSQRLLSSDLAFTNEITDIYKMNVEQINEVTPMTKLLRIMSLVSLGLLPVSTSAFNYALSLMNREYSMLRGIEKLERELMTVREDIETYISIGKANERDAIEDKKESITDRLVQLDIENQSLKQSAKMRVAPAITGAVGVELLSQGITPPPVLEVKTTEEPKHEPLRLVTDNNTSTKDEENINSVNTTSIEPEDTVRQKSEDEFYEPDMDFPDDYSYINVAKGGLEDISDDDLYEEDSQCD